VSVADADRFCLPGKAAGVVNTDPMALFFTDIADVYTLYKYNNLHEQQMINEQLEYFSPI